MAEFAIFDRDIQRRARRSSSRAQRSKSLPRATNALVAYDARAPERSSRPNVEEVVQLDEGRESLSPKLALVRHKEDNRRVVEDYRYDVRYKERTLVFEDAAGVMYYTLRKAALFCEDFETSFRFETQSMRHWCPARMLDRLWRAKTDWDGIPLEDPDQDFYPKGVGSIEHYNKHLFQLRQSWEDVKYAQPVSKRTFDASRIGDVEVKAAMKNLRMIFQRIEELWESVRADRTQLRALIYQLKLGMDALGEIEVVWNLPRRGSR